MKNKIIFTSLVFALLGAVVFTANAATTKTPTIKVVSPNGGEVWNAGTTKNIVFKGNLIKEPVAIAITKPNSEGLVIGRTTTSGNGQKSVFSWSIPKTIEPRNDYKISVRYDNSFDNSIIYDESDKTFTIENKNQKASSTTSSKSKSSSSSKGSSSSRSRSNSSSLKSSSPSSNWETYRNNVYGFELKYPSMWTLRNGNKDYKSTGLNNFYQFCNKVITIPDEPLGPNDNFVGRCEGEYLRVNIWKPTAEMKMIANDFATLKFDKENKITIGGKAASEFIYSGHSEILGGTHTWHLFVVKTNNYIYSITGDSCMDNKTDCDQTLSTFKFTR